MFVQIEEYSENPRRKDEMSKKGPEKYKKDTLKFRLDGRSYFILSSQTLFSIKSYFSGCQSLTRAYCLALFNIILRIIGTNLHL
jgi:hypothetical protein